MKGRHGTARHSDSHESVPMETIGIDAASVAMILSRLLGDPTPLDEDEAQQALELLSELDPEGFGKYRGVVEEFRRDWNAAMELLAGNAVPLPMEESLYKAWTTDAEHPLQGTEGFAWGDPAHHMLDVLKLPCSSNSLPICWRTVRAQKRGHSARIIWIGFPILKNVLRKRPLRRS